MAKARKVGKPAREAPTSACLLICDDVLVSQGKGKHYLQGLVGTIGVREIPAMIGGLVAYVRLSNVYSGAAIALAFETASTGEELFRFDAKLPDHSDPLGVYTIVLPIPPFEVREAGRYIFSAKHDGVPFAQSPILIQPATPTPEADQ